jgi:hypothetical protein
LRREESARRQAQREEVVALQTAPLAAVCAPEDGAGK